MLPRSPHLVHPGDKFSRLTVVEFSHNDKRARRHYHVVCDCGVRKVVQGTLLRTGNTLSCGCLGRERRRATRLPNDAGVVAHIVLQYKRHARDRHLKWDLSFSEVDALVRMPCSYCGIVGGNFKKTKNHAGFAHNGIDRIDSEKHYVAGNVVPCCGLCNRAKGAMPRDQFIDWARRVTAHQDAMADQWTEAVRGQEAA